MNNSQKIYNILFSDYGNVKTELNYNTILELLVATILSAQCTDKCVNMVTKDLFKKYKTVKDYAEADILSFQKDIYKTGFYRNKARNIIASVQMIRKIFNGQVPKTMKELLLLPGVARKTANIVLFYGYNKSCGIAVDTHVKRLSNRLGFSQNKDPNKIEKDLLENFNKDQWGQVSALLIKHGRNICKAKKPKCIECIVKKYCLFYETITNEII